MVNKMLAEPLTAYPYHEGFTDNHTQNFSGHALQKKIGLAA